MVEIMSKLAQVPKRRLLLLLALAAIVWAVVFPAAFLNLWLTPDQQGRLWFQLGDYERASRAFEDPRWRGFSSYAAEEFDTAEQYFSQYQDANSLLAHANALAHQTNYKGAKIAYQEMANRYPEHPAPAVNISVMEAIIKATKGSDQNDKPGDGKRKPGDGQKSTEGDGEQASGELEQLSAEQLLQDPELTEMWLRQIQRDPSEFLTTKFYLQIEQDEKNDNNE
ncbi:hypothetical protein JIN82_11150 [Persicirhabdus sediminis]|uniref:Ca-activated chloride channel family protein n=2 Tax=Persicirhabdus sediminis TaxID=454144 RepID=A0A8J7MDD3_9BACT|nr:hypothetical protein [Persicirhabdus sediminis]